MGKVRILNKTKEEYNIEIQVCPICKKPMDFDKNSQQYSCEKDGVCYNV